MASGKMQQKVAENRKLVKKCVRRCRKYTYICVSKTCIHENKNLHKRNNNIYIMNKYAKWRRLAKTTTITENLKKLTIQIVTKKQIPAVHLLREFRMCM